MNLVIIKPRCTQPYKTQRLDEVLHYALESCMKEEALTVEYIETAKVLKKQIQTEKLKNRKIFFAVSLGDSGINLEYYSMLKILRTSADCFTGSMAASVIDGKNEYYTKSVARELILTANIHGCVFPGSPLIEGTGSLKNFEVKASNMKKNNFEAYREFARKQVENLRKYTLPKSEQPELLCVHASNRQTSNTLGLWEMVRRHLEERCEIKEISLAQEDIRDCVGCNYSVCMKHGNQDNCIFNDAMVKEVYPELQKCNALVLLCPNYNDALGAELTAFINRLTALYRKKPFDDKYLFAVIVSGYSGGDIIAEQLIDSLNMNKSFILPGRFALTATANAPGDIHKLPGIRKRAWKFAGNMLETLTGDQYLYSLENFKKACAAADFQRPF